MSTVLLHSGGMDSHIAWLLHPLWTPVYVRHGAPAEDRELEALDKLARADLGFRPTIITDGPYLLAHRDGHIPYRNALLLTVVAHRYPNVQAVAYGSLLGEGTGDKSRTFRRALQRTWSASERPAPEVIAPLRRWTKAQALSRACKGRGSEHLALTWSCYDPEGPCDQCQACYRRGVAEFLVGWRSAMPPRPLLTEGIWPAVRSVPVTHLPSMALSNLDVARGWLKERTAR